MNTQELSALSYKELQALAVKHRIPGNIKKQTLVKILFAVEAGNNSEVTRILTDLRKNRKKRTKKLKVVKEERDSYTTKSYNSPDLCMPADNYLFPIQQQHQQQFPFQWVGAEEEVIGSNKYEDMKCALSYNDIRQYIFYSTQSIYGSCDTINNSTLIDEIMDLRTEATVSNYRSTLDTSFIHQTPQTQQQIMQNLKDNSANKKMSVLLKKMLQAPKGANLGAIASPVSNWNGDYYPPREDTPDNSETMTARSDINENDEIWQENLTPCVFDNEPVYNGDNSYFRNSTNAISYYRPYDNGMDQNTLVCNEQLQQQSQQLQQQQLQFNLGPQADPQENCRNWLASNPLEIQNPIDYVSTSMSRLPLPLPPPPATSMQYQNTENTEMLNPSSVDSSNMVQSGNMYCFNNEQLYPPPPPQNNLLEPTEIVPDLNFDASRYYDNTPVPTTSAIDNQMHQDMSLTHNNNNNCYPPPYPQDNFYEQSQHPPPAYPEYSSIYHVDMDNVSYENNNNNEYYQQQTQQQQQQHQQQQQQNSANNRTTSCDPLQQVQDQQYEGYATNSTPVSNPAPAYGAGVLDAYWPRWNYPEQNNVACRTGGRNLENTLNLSTPNYVNYSKLNETCCVYSNKTPVMTLRKGMNSAPSVQDSKTNSGPNENRQHNFASNWMLYNDGGVSGIDTSKHVNGDLDVFSSVEQQIESIM